MEKNCIFCENPIYPDAISYKVGEYPICYRCATTQTIYNLNNVINGELRVGPNIVDVTDSSLAGQTDSSYRDDEIVIAITCGEDMYEYEAKCLSKEDYFNKYVPDIMDKDGPSAMARDIWEKVHADSSLAGQTVVHEYIHDAVVMSEDDYLSKYVDDYDALMYWAEVHPESVE